MSAVAIAGVVGTALLPLAINAVEPHIKKLVDLGVEKIDDVVSRGVASLQAFGQPIEESSVQDIDFHTDLAYGWQLSKAEIEQMDEILQGMAASVIGSLMEFRADNPKSPLDWSSIVNICRDNVCLQEVKNTYQLTEETYTKDYGSGVFKFNGGTNQDVVREVQEWFGNKLLVGDIYAQKSTRIDVPTFANLVATTGNMIESFETFFVSQKVIRKRAMDIAMLRFPQMTDPYLRLYRIELDAFKDCSRIGLWQSDKSGISGKFERIDFVPLSKEIDELAKDARKSKRQMLAQFL